MILGRMFIIHLSYTIDREVKKHTFGFKCTYLLTDSSDIILLSMTLDSRDISKYFWKRLWEIILKPRNGS